jgi:hypothetical protein
MKNNPLLKLTDRVTIPMMMHPLFRVEYAIQNGVEKNLLFRTWGGIGDQICAEPTLRYALKMFKGCNISLASEAPEMFSHLKFDRVYNLKQETPDYDKYLLFDTITPPDDSNMVWLFFSHMLTNCVDFPSLCALRLQLPVADKEIILSGIEPASLAAETKRKLHGNIFIHPGRHWQSKTFPKTFWDRVIIGLKSRGVTPVIIGADADDNRGTVDVDASGCIDLRGKLSLCESIWALQGASVLLTNDSAPLHMAASGNSHIGFVATCKHPDLITHWRHGKWQWREKNFGKGGIWDHVDFCPNKGEKVEAEFVDPALLESWLPNPFEMASWAVDMRDNWNKLN